jgi:spermidine synthase
LVRRYPLHLFFLPLFFTSGFAALLYQMVWQRLLTFFSGADVYSVTIIVAAFMGGLGFGSLAGGHLADRLPPRGRLLAFAFAEAAISAFAFVSVPLIYGVLFLRLGERPLPSVAVAAVLFLTLLWPTFFMGLSLPLLARVLTEDAPRSAERVGALYGWNTLGAAAGALTTVWILARALGFAGSILVGALLNLACAAAALLLAGRAAGVPMGTTPPPAPPSPLERAPFRLPAWIAIYALSGFLALSLEILWFRLLGTILKSNSFTFATLLAIYLGGLGLGALLASRWARRSRRPALTFLLLQSGIPLYAGLSLGLLTHGLPRFAVLRPLADYLGGYETLELDAAIRALQRFALRAGSVAPFTRDLAGQFALLYGAVPLYLIGPPTLLMGMSFPYLQRAVQTDLALLGRRVGWLQTSNIVGSMIGAALTGVVLLHGLGSAWTLRLLVALGAVFFLLFARARWPADARRRWLGYLGALAAAGLAALASPSPAILWARLHGTTPDRVLFAEDGSGLALLKEEREGTRETTVVYVNGLGQSSLPYGGYHTLLGALPAMLHPRPEAIAIIGLGSGDTLFGAAGRPETTRLDCVEIVACQLPTLERLPPRRYPGLDLLLRDARVRYVFADGRSQLMRGQERYDIIEADALRAGSAYSGNLYSREYFELLRRRLRPGGFGVSWAPTRRVRDTFVSVFPHVLKFQDTLIGSNEAMAFDREAVRARMRDPFVRSHYLRAGLDVEELLDEALERGPTVIGPETDRTSLRDINTDLFPRDEYLASQSFLAGAEERPRPQGSAGR